MAARITTDLYVNTHGSKPKGQGLWLFMIDGDSDLFQFTGKYSDAIKAAKKEAKERGSTSPVIKVMP